MEFFLSRRGLGIGGHVVQEGAPCHLACAEGLGCGRGGWRNSEKGDKLSLCTWLASEGTVGVGQVRLLSLCTWTCVRLGGDTGVRGRKVQKGGASRGGMPHVDPVTCPVARDPHLHISGGGGQRGGVEVCTPSHWGQGSKGWCGGSHSESLGARVKGRDGVPFTHRSGSLAWVPRQGGTNPTCGGWGNACPCIKQEAYQAYPSLLCHPCCA